MVLKRKAQSWIWLRFFVFKTYCMCRHCEEGFRRGNLRLKSLFNSRNQIATLRKTTPRNDDTGESF